jgi:predicted DNA-binding ribbon-helix-helix protein
LKEIAADRDMTLQELVAAIDGNREHANLSSAIRLFVLGIYRDQVAEASGGTLAHWLERGGLHSLPLATDPISASWQR